MSMDATTFSGRISNIVASWPWYSNVSTELNAIRIALGADATTHDTTIQTAPVGLQPGNYRQTPFTNAVLQEVNKGKAGNLSNITMANLIGGATPGPSAPVNVVPPTITYVTGGAGAGTQPGAQYASGVGSWDPPAGQNTRTNQWLRDGSPIAGATAATYTTASADGGTSIALQITMTNTAGSGSAVSNSAAIAA